MKPTLVTFLLDRTGSMASIKQPTIDSFNAYLKSLQEDKGDGLNVEFTFLQFDSISLDKIYVCEPIAKVQPLNDKTFQPRDMTPLIDASVKTIKAVEAALKTRTDDPKVVICIQTDGHENASREYNWGQLKELIAQKTAEGWEFNFLGAGIDAYQQAAQMGISAVNTVSYDKDDRVATMAMFESAASNTRGYATGARMNTSYTAQQKMAAGDVFDPAARRSVIQPMSSPLDLNKPKDKPVEDFTLGPAN